MCYKTPREFYLDLSFSLSLINNVTLDKLCNSFPHSANVWEMPNLYLSTELLARVI